MPRLEQFPHEVPEHILVHLTEREQMAVTRFVELRWRQSKIAENMHITRGRVTQLLDAALDKINGTYIPIAQKLNLEDVEDLPASEFAAKA